MAFPATAPYRGTVRPRRPLGGTGTTTPVPRTTSWERWPGYPGESFRLPAVPRSVGVARTRARQALHRWQVPAPAVENAVLIVSELTTNVLSHTDSQAFVCFLRDDDDRLHVEVMDQHRGPGAPWVRAARPGDEHGRGLALIQALSTAWGVADVPDARGQAVWASLPRCV
jgi:anti-sigma regulatory factor (Ser/Thr protein kinase)